MGVNLSVGWGVNKKDANFRLIIFGFILFHGPYMTWENVKLDLPCSNQINDVILKNTLLFKLNAKVLWWNQRC